MVHQPSLPLPTELKDFCFVSVVLGRRSRNAFDLYFAVFLDRAILRTIPSITFTVA